MENVLELKKEIRNFWNKKPCGTLGLVPESPDLQYFLKIKERRYRLEPFIKNFAKFDHFRGKRVLEIGCGVGIDGAEFARSCADYTGVDGSDISIDLAKRYFALNGFKSNLVFSDIEKLPFQNNEFDFVYSWGVIHHTPNMPEAVQEVYRVLKPGGNFCIMVYNRHSLVGLQLYILYGLFKLNPFRNFKELFSKYHESPGTKALTNGEAEELFKNFRDVSVKNLITPYDVRITRNLYLPEWFQKIVPSRFGFFKIIAGGK